MQSTRVAFGVCAWLATAAACSPAPVAQTSALSADGASIPWGAGLGQLGLRPTVGEIQTKGPSALALDPHGRAVVVDRYNGRVVRFAGGSAEVLFAAPEDTDLIAVGDDGAIVIYSALHAHIEIFAPGGIAQGGIEVPRALGELRAITLGASRRVSVSTALQERYELGSPSFPLPLEVVLASKQEGTHALPEHRGLAIRTDKREVSLLIASAGAERSTTQVRRLPGLADAAQLVGVDGAIACARLETLHPGASIALDRRLVCLDVNTGAVTLDRALPALGLYLPRTELTMTHGVVALMTPLEGGMAFTRYAIVGGGAR